MKRKFSLSGNFPPIKFIRKQLSSTISFTFVFQKHPAKNHSLKSRTVLVSVLNYSCSYAFTKRLPIPSGMSHVQEIWRGAVKSQIP